MHQALMKLLNEATFSFKAREVPTFLKVYEWARELPTHFDEKKKEKTVRKKSGRN